MNFRILLPLLFCFLAPEARGDSGPVIPCDRCSAEHVFVPKTGFWFNPDRPGSGLTLESQAGLLLGALYAYRADGSAHWYTFNGRLETTDEAPGKLALTAPLEEFARGMCPNCPYSPPDPVGSAGRITLEFTQRNYGAYAIDGGEKQFIVPLVAGVAAPNDFSPLVEYGFPNLKGPWTFVLDNPSIAGHWGTSSVLLHIGDKALKTDAQGRTAMLSYPVLLYTARGPDITVVGSLMCISDTDATSNRVRPFCQISLSLAYPGLGSTRLTFPLEYANIGDERMQATEPESGMRLQVFRVDYN